LPPIARNCVEYPELAKLGDANKREHETESPRAALVRTLTEGISAATASGDLAAARVAHEALGKLLDEPERGNAEVIDIRSQRAGGDAPDDDRA